MMSHCTTKSCGNVLLLNALQWLSCQEFAHQWYRRAAAVLGKQRRSMEYTLFGNTVPHVEGTGIVVLLTLVVLALP